MTNSLKPRPLQAAVLNGLHTRNLASLSKSEVAVLKCKSLSKGGAKGNVLGH